MLLIGLLALAFSRFLPPRGNSLAEIWHDTVGAQITLLVAGVWNCGPKTIKIEDFVTFLPGTDKSHSMFRLQACLRALFSCLMLLGDIADKRFRLLLPQIVCPSITLRYRDDID